MESGGDKRSEGVGVGGNYWVYKTLLFHVSGFPVTPLSVLNGVTVSHTLPATIGSSRTSPVSSCRLLLLLSLLTYLVDDVWEEVCDLSGWEILTPGGQGS